jgi:hypothetical protein
MSSNGYLTIPKEFTGSGNTHHIICMTCSAFVYDPEAHDKWHADGQPMTAEDKQEVMDGIRQIIAEQGPPQATNQGLRWAVPVVLVDRDKCYHPEDNK